MKAFRFVLAQWAVWGIALGAVDPPPLPSYHFGITGEPTKEETAFGNLGAVGPVYSLPERRNDSNTISTGNPIPLKEGKTDGPTKSTEPPKIAKPTTAGSTGKVNNSNDVEDITTVRTTDRKEITLPESLNGTTEKELEASTISNSTQTYGTTIVPSESPASTITVTGSDNNRPPATEQATKNPEDIATPSTPSSSFTTPSNASTSQDQNTTDGSPSQSFHTGPPTSSTDAPTTPHSPERNETKPGQNLTLPTRPNSSASIHTTEGRAWLTLVGISLYAFNKL